MKETIFASTDKGDPIPFKPILKPELQERLHLLVYEIAFNTIEQQVKALDFAIRKIKNEQEERYLEDANLLTPLKAAVMLLRDLLQMGWNLRLVGPDIQLIQPSVADDAGEAKKQVKASMRFERIDSMRSTSVQDFIRHMERPRIVQGAPRSVLSLVADGYSLSSLLDKAVPLPRDEATSLLRESIRPYLQLITAQERDVFTGLRLIDVWRYFRLSWSTPYRPTPGRNLFYLVRDAAQPCHPIMGIAALANCVIGLKCRDDLIGWTPEALAVRLRKARELGEEHFKEVAWEEAHLLQRHLENGLEAIATDEIATPNTILYPTEEAVADLQRLATDAATERYAHLQNEAIQQDMQALEGDFELIRPSENSGFRPRKERASSFALFRRKRASKLASLLQAKLICQRYDVFSNAPEGLARLLWNNREWSQRSDIGRSALRVIMQANKESKVGSAMMEIIVCGAIPPYNNLLAGKLVAMLMSSSQVIRDYEARYEKLASTIASQVAGRDIIRPAHLVYLVTSSLYVGSSDKSRFKIIEEQRSKEDWRAFECPVRLSSSSQYNRIRIPCDITGSEGAIMYESLGVTKGFGVVHFADETRQALEELDFLHLGGKRVNSLFGEGTSPRMRKIRQGLSLLGLDERFLVHGHARLVYGIELARNAKRYLNGQEESPDYLWPIEDPQSVTEAISSYWIDRWLVSRIKHQPALELVRSFRATQSTISLELETDIPQERLL